MRKQQRYSRAKLIEICFWSFVLSFLLAFEVACVLSWEKPLFNPVVYAQTPTPTATLEPKAQGGHTTTVGVLPTEKPTVKEVKDYLRTIFGNKARIAWAIAENECNHTRNEWPICVNSWGDTPTSGEYSIGMFQINIARQGGRGNKVHWDKIHGDTLEQKVEWLGNWKNNILTAYVISQGGTNWNPWSVYKNQSYKRSLNSF